MSLFVLALVLLSAVLHAWWNYYAKTIPSGAPFVWLVAVLVSLLYLPVVLGYGWLYGFHVTGVQGMFLLGTAVLHLVYFLVLQRGYQLGDLSVVYPLARGTGPLLAALGAIWLFGEPLTATTALGLACVLGGVLLVAGFGGAAADRARRTAGVTYGVSTGALIAAYTLWDSYAVRQLALAPILLDYVSHPLRITALWPIVRRDPAVVRRLWADYRGRLLFIAVVSPLSFLLVLYALRHAPVSHVAPAREFSIVIGVFLGARLLTEPHFRRRLAGAGLIVAGIVFLSLSK